VASDWSTTYTPNYGGGQFVEATIAAAGISPYVNGSWTSLVVVNPGNRTWVDLYDTSGSNYLEWRPNLNGASYFIIYYYVVNSAGEKSNEAALTVNVSCNTNTQCQAPAPPP
jgi:hypothetical protein